MMFMITMPATTSARPTTPTSTAKIPVVAWLNRFSAVSEVKMPKLSSSVAFRRRSISQGHGGFADCPVDLAGIGWLHANPERGSAAEDPLERAERNDRELILRLSER